MPIKIHQKPSVIISMRCRKRKRMDGWMNDAEIECELMKAERKNPVKPKN